MLTEPQPLTLKIDDLRLEKLTDTPTIKEVFSSGAARYEFEATIGDCLRGKAIRHDNAFFNKLRRLSMVSQKE